MLEDPESGTPKDRMRLLLVYFLCHPSLSDQDVERLCGILEVRLRFSISLSVRAYILNLVINVYFLESNLHILLVLMFVIIVVVVLTIIHL